jgi:hypothetical protein
MGMAGSLLLGDVFRLESGSESPQLIELYTSEGCSSCPPAEKWLSGFLKDPGLWTHRVPVAFHVDYWDRLGWKDKYASRENTLRQYRFRDEGAVKSIYTPGFLVNGQEWRGWFQGRSIDEVRSKVADGKLIIEIDDGKLVAAYSGTGDSAVLNVAILGLEMNSKVLKGENRGRLLNHNFVALEYRELPILDGRAELVLPQIDSDVASRFGLAAWVVSPGGAKPKVVVGNWLPRESLTLN